MKKHTFVALALLSVIGLSPVVALAQTAGYPELTEDAELRLAMSAGPLTVSQKADVYVMRREGFARAITGTNGWACIVVRNAGDKRQLAPHCLNPQAVKSVLSAFLREGKMQMKGMSGDAISAEILRLFTSKELELPSGPAYAYMLSEGQRIGKNAGNFKPHFMLYIPYVTNEAIGGDLAQMQFPFVGPFEDHPLATVVILMPEFVSPGDVVLPRR